MRKAVENAMLVGLVSAREVIEIPPADTLLAEFVNIFVFFVDDNHHYQNQYIRSYTAKQPCKTQNWEFIQCTV